MMRFDFQDYQRTIMVGRYLAVQIPEEMLLMYGFVASIRPHHIIEVGTAMGGVFVGLCKLSTGKKISVDLIDGPFKVSYVETPSGKTVTQSPEHRKTLKSVDRNVILIDGDSTSKSVLAKVKKALGRAKVDFVFIDGDHSAEGSWADYQNYSKFVKPGGWIGFHDIVDSAKHRAQGCLVSETWSRVKKLHKNHVEILGGGDWAGIGLVQKD